MQCYGTLTSVQLKLLSQKFKRMPGQMCAHMYGNDMASLNVAE